jgi:hypothetical protein
MSFRNWDTFNGKKVTSDFKPKNPKSSWVRGANGDYDGVPRAYLNAKVDSFLLGKRKHPWEK